MCHPTTCPVCQGRQLVYASFYEAEDDDTGMWDRIHAEKAGLPDPTPRVLCRSCGGTGVVWPPEPEGPIRITGDLVIEGNVVATGYREWVLPDQMRGLDVVTGEIPDPIPDVEPYIQGGG